MITVAAWAWACGGAEPRPAAPVLSPEGPRAAELLSTAAVAWATATGLEIQIAAGGIPVQIAAGDEPSDAGYCGHVSTVRERHTGRLVRIRSLRINPELANCGEPARVMTHELGHVLCDYWHPQGRPAGKCHSQTGLMARAHNEVRSLDRASLEVVCAHAPCRWLRYAR